MARTRQVAIGERIVQIIRGLGLDFIERDDVRLESYAVDSKILSGVVVSPMTEVELVGLNNSDDVSYPFLVVWSASGLDTTENVPLKSEYRQAMFRAFNMRRIGLPEGLNCCEIVTRLRFDDIESRREWDRNNRDNTALVITVTVRIPRSSSCDC